MRTRDSILETPSDWVGAHIERVLQNEYDVAIIGWMDELTIEQICSMLSFESETDVPTVYIHLIPKRCHRLKNARIRGLKWKDWIRDEGSGNYSAPPRESPHGMYYIDPSDTDAEVIIENCWIDNIEFLGVHPDTKLRIIDSWIGHLDMKQHKFKEFEIIRGGLLLPTCPPPYRDNPFVGSVNLDRIYTPRKDGEYKEKKEGSQPWANIRAHVLALGNQKAADICDAAQLSIDKQYESSCLVKLVSGIYRISSDYGNSITLPIVWLIGLAAVAFISYLFFDGAVQAPGDRLEIFSSSDFQGQVWRALYLSAQPILNPLGGILGGSPPVEPSNVCWAILHGAHRLVSIMLIFLLFLGIRRRFRM